MLDFKGVGLSTAELTCWKNRIISISSYFKIWLGQYNLEHLYTQISSGCVPWRYWLDPALVSLGSLKRVVQVGWVWAVLGCSREGVLLQQEQLLPPGQELAAQLTQENFVDLWWCVRNVTDSQSEIRIKKQLQKVKCIHRRLSYCLILNITSSFPTIQEMPITYFIVLIPGWWS